MDVQADTPNTSSAPDADGAGVDQIPGGRYHIVQRLSTGAIGAVYKALDTILDRPVAVKCVRLDTPFADQTPDELRERFVREARIAARLQHPNIVTIHDIIATPDRGYIIMEFIEGRTLESLIESERRLPLDTATTILSQLASALDYAHGRNVVHRDVKPSNILVSPSMYVWVTDFGIAKSELSTNLTMAGGVLGAPDYMSPEQAKGEDVDARTDLFSLGCILFECVVGEKPFRSPSLTGVLLSIINDEPVFPLNWRSLGLPTGLKPVLHHALEKEREKRYPSGAELVAALEELTGAVSKPSVTVTPEASAKVTGPEPEAESAAPEAEAESAAPEAEAESAAPEPEVKTAAPEVEAQAAPPEPEAKTAAPESEAKTAAPPEPEVKTAAPEVEAQAAPPEPEAKTAAPESEAKTAAPPEPEAQAAPPEPEAKTAAPPEPEVKTAAPEPEVKTAAPPEPEAKTAAPEPEAKTAAPEPETATPEPEAESAAPEPEAESAPPEPEAESAAPEPEAEAAPPEPEAEAAPPEPEAEAAAPETEAESTPPPEPEGPDASSDPAQKAASRDVQKDAAPEPKEEERPELTAEQIQSLRDESQVLHLSPTLSADLQGVEITPEEGFLLSRIDGASRPNDIMSVSPMAEAETARALMTLLEKKLVRLGGVTTETSVPGTSPRSEPPRPAKPEKKPAGGADAATVEEVDRLLALAKDKAYPALLGLPSDAPEPKRKAAYLKIVARFHPDRFQQADAAFREKLSSLCAAASEAVTDFEEALKAQEKPAEPPRPAPPSPTNGHAPASSTVEDSSSEAFDKSRYARELYDRALTAFDKADFWDAIQLGRQAIDADATQAEFYCLLGRALLQNKKWRKEAADNFLKASELEPGNVTYIGLLGAIYQTEGLTARANAMLKRARAIDPDFEFPEIDGEAGVVAE